MVVHHARSLHEGVANGGTHKGKARLFQGFAHCVRLSTPRGNLLLGFPVIDLGFAPSELPKEFCKTPMLFFEYKVCLGVLHRSIDLQAVADDARVVEELADFGGRVLRNLCRIEIVESFLEVPPLVQNCPPAQTGLERIQHHELEKFSIVPQWHAPLGIVVAEHDGICAGPNAGFHIYLEILNFWFYNSRLGKLKFIMCSFKLKQKVNLLKLKMIEPEVT